MVRGNGFIEIQPNKSAKIDLKYFQCFMAQKIKKIVISTFQNLKCLLWIGYGAFTIMFF